MLVFSMHGKIRKELTFVCYCYIFVVFNFVFNFVTHNLSHRCFNFPVWKTQVPIKASGSVSHRTVFPDKDSQHRWTTGKKGMFGRGCAVMRVT